MKKAEVKFSFDKGEATVGVLVAALTELDPNAIVKVTAFFSGDLKDVRVVTFSGEGSDSAHQLD